jgi:hypothetical protein
LKIPALIVADRSLESALEAGLDAARLSPEAHSVATAYIGEAPHDIEWVKSVVFTPGAEYSHLIALERVGPSHTPASIRAQPGMTAEAMAAFAQLVPPAEQDRCHSMRGRDITSFTGPAHQLFEWAVAHSPRTTTIGIGDGGNEIGMGKIAWDVIRRNIPRGELVACRVPTDHLIVCGVSNWGAYGLGAGVRLLRGAASNPELFDVERERALLDVMVKAGPLVDGVSGRQTATVDGLTFDRYVEPLRRLASVK